MNIFLDTTVFHNGKDVFMNNTYSKLLFDIARYKGFKVYISEVVIAEARRQYQLFITSQIKNITTAVGAFNFIPGMKKIDVSIPKIEESMKKFDDYYKELEEKGEIEIVGYDNSILPELVNRAVNRIKPFTEGKQEFRDAVIWLSYALLAEERKLEKCLLITGNTADYCSKNKELHPDLLKDSERFTLYKDAYTLLEADNMKEFKEEYELTKLQIKERHEAFLALREEAKHWSSDEIINMLSIPDLSSTLKLAIENYIFNHSLLNVREIIDIKFARSWILSTDYIDDQYTMRGTLSVNVHVEENQNWGIRISRVLDDIHVVFQAIYSEEDKKINSIIVESTDSELDYDGAHIYQDLH